MISHLIENRFTDALQLTGSELDTVALNKITGSVTVGRTLTESRIYMAHPIMGQSSDVLESIAEDYIRFAKSLSAINLRYSQVIPRLIDPSEIEVGFDDTMETNPQALVDGDLSMIDTCDILVYDFRQSRYSAGACMELFYASRILKIPTILVTDAAVGPNELSPWLRAHSTYITSDMEKAVDIANTILRRHFSFEKNPVLVEKRTPV